jgi:serine/threonine-protein kinase
VLLAVSLWAVGAPRLAHASDPVAAQALFDEARRLMASGAYAEACPKLAESQRLDPGIGTLFNLADCYERTGRLASAWAAYLEVAAATKTAGQVAREEVARDRATALEPRLCRLTIHAESLEGLGLPAVSRDEKTLGPDALGVAVPVDSGTHTVSATANGKKSWSTRVVVSGEGESISVEIPHLEPDAPTQGAVEELAIPATRSAESGPRRAVRWSLLALGGAGIAAGTYLAVRAIADWSGGDGSCSGNACRDPGFGARTGAAREGDLATVAFIVGAAASAGGVLLWLTAPSTQPTPRQASVGPNIDVSSRGATVSLQGHW